MRSSAEHREPPVLVALLANQQPLPEAERKARRIAAERRRTQAILRAAERDFERYRCEQELQAVRRFEIQEAAQEIVNQKIVNSAKKSIEFERLKK